MSNRDEFSEFDQAHEEYEQAGKQPEAGAEQPPENPPAPPTPVEGDDDLEALIGQMTGQTQPAVPTEPEPPVEEPPAPVQDQTVPYERFQELLDRLNRAEGALDTLTRQQVATEHGEPEDPLEGIEPGVVDLVSRVAGHIADQKLGELRPVLDRVTKEAAMESIREQVPGYDDAAHAEAQRMVSEMSPELRAQYEASEVGHIAVAAQAVLRTAGSKPPVDTPQPKGNANQAHTVNRSQGMSEPPRKPVNPHSLSDENFDALVEGLKRRANGAAGAADGPDDFLDGAI